jgi:hypothetical protein
VASIRQAYWLANLDRQRGDAKASPAVRLPRCAGIARRPAAVLGLPQPASAIALIGLLYSAYLCCALEWRCNGFITGGTGVGKSALQRVLRGALPLHAHSNEASKAGIEQAVSGMAIPVIIDEANDRKRSSGRDLIDIILSATGDEGTRLARGTSDGKGRSSEVVTSIIMFSINPPELEPQHLNRFVMIELMRPEEGADHGFEHRQLAEFARRHGPGLWGRAISAWDRYVKCLDAFRGVLREKGCDPRAMDGQGALLAGWFVLTHEGLPSCHDLAEGVAALDDFLIVDKHAQAIDGPRRCLEHLLASLIPVHRSGEHEPIGILSDRAFGSDPDNHPAKDASEHLQKYGVRPIRACKAEPQQRTSSCSCAHCLDPRTGKRIPRQAPGAGFYIATTNPALPAIFRGTPYGDGRWQHELARLPGSGAKQSVRIGGATCYAIWIDRADLHAIEDME